MLEFKLGQLEIQLASQTPPTSPSKGSQLVNGQPINCPIVDRKVVAICEENKKAMENLRRLHLELSNKVTR